MQSAQVGADDEPSDVFDDFFCRTSCSDHAVFFTASSIIDAPIRVNVFGVWTCNLKNESRHRLIH